MAIWTCPGCRRDFGAVGRGHMCTPGLTVGDFLAGVPGFVRPVFEAVDGHLRSVDDAEDGDLIVDPLDQKVLFKNGPTFCILDVKRKWVAVGFSLRRPLATSRLSRKTSDYGGRHYHVVNVADPDIIDNEFRDWLTEAYHHGAQGKGATPRPSSIDPMLPDDVDFEIAPPR